jgi:predicted transcriptional regulator
MTLTVRLPDRAEQELAEYCVKRRITKSEAVKEALMELLSANAGGPSAYDLGKDLFGPHTDTAPTADVARHIASAMHSGSVKSATIPPLRVPQKLRAQAVALLEKGETISAFMLDALSRNIEFRRARRDFIARGLASAARARKTGKYVSADKVIEKLARKLAKAKQRAA